MAPAKRSSGRKPRQTKTKRELSQLQPQSMLRGNSNSEDVKVGGRTKKQRDNRPANEAQRLNAVNGKVIPSTLGSGQRPLQGEWTEDETTVYPCSICGMRFKRKYNVKSHMAACVKRNGNPNGAKWDDAWMKTISAEAEDEGNNDDADNNDKNEEVEEMVEEDEEMVEEDEEMVEEEEELVEEEEEMVEEEEEENDDDDNDDAAEPSIDLQESESRDRSEELVIPDSQPDSPFREHSITGNSPVDFRSASSTPIPPSSTPVPPSSSPVPQSSSPAPQSSPQPSPNVQLHDEPAVGSLAGYDPSLRIDILANDGLMQIVDAWDNFYFYQRLRGGDMGTHPQLERVMEELQIRGIAHEHRSWISGAMHRAWTLDLEGVDMRYQRVKTDRSGS